MKRLLALLLAGVLAQAALGAGAPAERARIRAERAQAEQRYDEEERVCRTRFAVTSCLNEARSARSATLDRLRREAIVIDDAERKQRAAERTARIREKQAEVESSMPASASRGERAAPPAPTPHVRLRAAPAPAGAASAAGIAPGEAERNRAAYEAKQREAEAHRQAVQRRTAEHAKKTKPAAPLPTPSAVP